MRQCRRYAAAIFLGGVLLAAITAGQVTANEVIRTQISSPFVKCEEWSSVRKTTLPRRAELEEFVRGYAEGVAAHISSRPKSSTRFSIDGLYRNIDTYCSKYDDTLQAAVETVLEEQWPAAGSALTSDRPASKDEYIFVPNGH